jgi:uncharacterized damage-inducible protein DinB
MSSADLRYPIGAFEFGLPVPAEERPAQLRQLAEAPDRLRAAVAGLSASQLDTGYREGGWTARQVVHHLADAHLNWYVRVRLALTEDQPTIRPYDEVRWAELQDARESPVELSLQLFDGLHGRWVRLFESLAPADWARRFLHPERGWLTIESILPVMAWHCRHHTAHITELRKRMGW